jgi:excisionase family DNA binding protein
MSGPLYLTVKEYALYRRVSVRTVERWLGRGYLPAERMGTKGQWRIRVWRSLSDHQPENPHVFSAMGMCD